MGAPCENCGEEVTLRYGHREGQERRQLCRECHPERSAPD